MTRDEASFILANIDRRVCDDELNDALDMAIKALEQEPCEDWYDVPSNEMILERARQASKDLRKRFREDLEQEPKTGRWIVNKGSLDALYGEVCKCSVCGIESIGESDYCPSCGAKMVDPQESELKDEDTN